MYSRAAFYLSTTIKGGRGLAPDSGGSANIPANSTAAFEASLKLDISHRGFGGILEMYSRAAFYLSTTIKCGRGLAPDSGKSANIPANSTAALEASLKLDISHRGLAVSLRSTAGLLSTCQQRSSVGGGLPPIAAQPAHL